MCLTPLIEFALNAEYPRFVGLAIRVHRSFPPSCKSIIVLLPFAMCAAFPRPDYYGSFALGVVLLRPLRLAQFRAGRTIQVPVFRSSTFMSLGGGLYPWRCRRRTEESVAVSGTLLAAQQ